MIELKQRGGARPGSGRPKIGAISCHLTLREGDISLFKTLGNGNMSQGARLCADVLTMIVAVPELFNVVNDEAEALTILQRDIDFSTLLIALKEIENAITSSDQDGVQGVADSSLGTQGQTSDS